MNAINVIAPYKHQGMWVFDDPRVGLVQEPFVAGADTVIDRVVVTFLMLSVVLPWSSPALPSQDTNIALIGSVKKAAATGTMRRS
jgi:hypothetical protein